MKFRKKPVVIEAEQFRGSLMTLSEDFASSVTYEVSGDRHRYFVKTPEGQMTVTNGDWIIRGVKGEYYPCMPDVFEMTYEPVE